MMENDPEKIKINRFNKMSKISIADEVAIRKEIRNKIDDKTGPTFIRLSFHTLASFDVGSKSIFLDTVGNSRNSGLKAATELLDNVVKNHKDKELSKCDVWSLAGVIAVEVMGGPKIPFKFGRKDGTKIVDHIPGINLDPEEVRKDFKPLGLTDRDIVALIGAHTVGRSHLKFKDTNGKWTEQNNRFTNQFYVNAEKTFNKQTLTGQTLNSSEKGFRQGPPDMIMLASDLSLFNDQNLKEIAKNYAKNQNVFFDDFAEAYGKLLRRSLP